jgi:hypothetical protein
MLRYVLKPEHVAYYSYTIIENKTSLWLTTFTSLLCVSFMIPNDDLRVNGNGHGGLMLLLWSQIGGTDESQDEMRAY